MPAHKKMKEAVKTMVYLDKPEHDALRRIYEQTGAPMAELIRRAVKAYLARQGKAVRR
jgi:hypothetical protein